MTRTTGAVFWIFRICTIQTILFTGVLANSGLGFTAERPKPTLTITTEVKQALEVSGHPATVSSNSNHVAAEIKGTEESGCVPYGRQSYARGETSALIQDQAADHITFQLQSNLFTHGGHLRNCGACVSDKCVGIFPKDTTAKAGATAKATIHVKFPSHVGRAPWHLAIQKSHLESGLKIGLFGPNENEIKPLLGTKDRYLLEGRANDAYFANVELTKSSRNEGECCQHEDAGSVIITARVEQGAVLYSNKLEPYIRGGTLTASYAEVGVVRKDGLAHCSGTLIGKQTVLTAAHCIAGFENQIKDGRFTFGIGTSATKPDKLHKVTNGVFPNDAASGFKYNIFTNEDDIGLFYLGAPANVSPARLHSGKPDWTTMKAFPLLFVGYGFNVIGGEKTGIGMKREAEWPIDRVKNRVIEWDFSTKTTCKGDSGGPTFYTKSNSRVLVAITSVGDDSCTIGRNTRVDSYLTWIRPRILN